MNFNHIQMIDKISLREAKQSDARFLYELLSERQIGKFISHKKMPTWEEHVKFVKSRPYAKWYIINLEKEKAGTISLTKQNEVGIYIKNNIKQKGVGTISLKLLIKENPNLRYLANINPKNRESINFFKKNGFKLIQYTYEKANYRQNIR